MSIMQEYQRIREEKGKEECELIDTYLEENPQIFLSDLFYNLQHWKQYEEWKKGR